MQDLESADIKNWDHLCIVCSKSVDQGGGLAHIKAGARMIALCCPLCIETFNKDPMHYLKLRNARELSTDFRNQTGGSTR
jgi:hypothetical protein